MNMNSRLRELKRKHDTLSEAVKYAQKQPSSDTLEIVGLKKQKMRLKEEIQRLSV